jgi:MATE family multidrug resistance protein
MLQQILRENRRTLGLALPIIAGFIGQMLMGVADTIMVGWVGVTPLAACAFANTILSVPMVFGFGILSSVSVSASHAHGAGKPADAGEALRGGMLIALVMGLLLVAMAYISVPHLASFGQPPEINGIVHRYYLYISWSLLPVFITGVAKNFCESLEHPWPPFWIMIGGVGMNVVLNWVFIFGNLGCPSMGLDGAGLATLISRVATMIGVVAYAAWSPILKAAWPRRWFAPGIFSECRHLLDIGLHSGGLNLCEVSGFAFGSLMMGWLGVASLAAHQIAITCAGTTFMVPLGLGQALSVRVGNARGAGRESHIPTIVYGTLLLTSGLMLGFAAIYLLCGEWIASLFVLDPVVKELTVQLMVLAGVFQIFDGIQIVSSGGLRGFRDTKIPFLMGVVSYWVVALPVSWFAAFRWGFGARGIWMGFVIGLAVAAIALSSRLYKKISSGARSPHGF